MVQRDQRNHFPPPVLTGLAPPRFATGGVSQPPQRSQYILYHTAISVNHAFRPVTVQTSGDLPTIRPLVEGQPSTEFPLQTVSVPSNVNSYFGLSYVISLAPVSPGRPRWAIADFVGTAPVGCPAVIASAPQLTVRVSRVNYICRSCPLPHRGMLPGEFDASVAAVLGEGFVDEHAAVVRIDAVYGIGQLPADGLPGHHPESHGQGGSDWHR